MNRILASVLVLIAITTTAQERVKFPFIEGENLVNEFLDIPTDLKGKYSIIGLAYSKKSEKDLITWFSPAYNQFIYQPETPSLFYGRYDIHVYFIPMFTGAKRSMYQVAMEKTKKNTDPKLQPYVLFYKGKLKSIKTELSFTGKDVPYFYILNPEGDIVFKTSGAYSDAKMQKIVDKLADARKN